MPINLVVASHNPVKLEAAVRGFQRMFPGEVMQVHPVHADSGVGDQPVSDQETLKGARQRTDAAAELVPEADYWIGIEGGVGELNGGLSAFAWVVVRSGNRYGSSRTGTFFLPAEVARLVRSGVELGTADDQVFGRSNSKQANGAVGLLTNDAINRIELYEQAVVLALIPFLKPALYPD